MNLNPNCIACGKAVIHVNETMCAPCETALVHDVPRRYNTKPESIIYNSTVPPMGFTFSERWAGVV